MPFISGGGNIAKLAYDKSHEAKQTADQAKEKSDLTKNQLDQISQQLVDGSFETGILDTHIEQKLSDLETQYAPQLTSLSASLAQNQQYLNITKKNLGVAVSLKHHNLSEVDKIATYKSQALSLKNINSSVQLVCFITVDSLNSTTFLTPNFINLIKPFMDYCVDNDIKVSLVKVHLVKEIDSINHVPDDGLSGGKADIKPANGQESSWFTNYEIALKSLINMYSGYGVDHYVIANENLGLARTSAYNSYWKNLFNSLRNTYPNYKFGYSSQRDEQKWFVSEKQVRRETIVNYVDFIGVNIYPKMSGKTTYNTDETDIERKKYMKNDIKFISELHRLYPNKEMYITESGSTGTLGSLYDPGDTTQALNDEVQMIYISNILYELASRDYVKGFYIWHVRAPFNFIGTSAEDVVKDYYGKWGI